MNLSFMLLIVEIVLGLGKKEEMLFMDIGMGQNKPKRRKNQELDSQHFQLHTHFHSDQNLKN